MRPLWGLNALAIVAFATPALLIFMSSGHELAKNPMWAGVFLTSLIVGCASLFASMIKLSRGRANWAFGLLVVGLGLVALPVCALVLAPPA